MRDHKKVRNILMAATLLLAAVGGSSAQVLNSGAQPVALNATLKEAVTVTLSASAVNFTLTAGSPTNAGSTSVTATTSWSLKPTRISNNGGAFNALSNTVPFGGANAGLLLSTTPILGINRSGSRTDLMKFNINLTGTPNLPSGLYTGTLTIQAQAI